MLRFLCSTTMCLQQMLGLGFVVSQDSSTLVYSTFSDQFVCRFSGPSYACTQASQMDRLNDPFYR
jgi:hypothetical protein